MNPSRKISCFRNEVEMLQFDYALDISITSQYINYNSKIWVSWIITLLKQMSWSKKYFFEFEIDLVGQNK